ncbi:hypothetical protein Anas_14159, partial [Armadillidium nasatum]
MNPGLIFEKSNQSRRLHHISWDDEVQAVVRNWNVSCEEKLLIYDGILEEGVEQDEDSQKDFKDFQFTTDTSNNDKRSYGETSKDVLIGSGILKEEKEEVEEDKESQEDFKEFGYPTDYLKDDERTHESDDDLSEDVGRK